MSSYKEHILNLNYCLYSQLGANTLARDDSLLILNPRNPIHQQSNICCRLRFQTKDEQAFQDFLLATKSYFKQLGLVPRYFVDELATPSLNILAGWFEQYGHTKVEIDTDIIMACTLGDYENAIKEEKEKDDRNKIKIKKATLNHVDALAQTISASFRYGDDIEWLKKKLTTQIMDHQTSVYILQNENDGKIISTAIINCPDCYPNFIHINVCATHPDYQKKGFGKLCLQQALPLHLTSSDHVAYLEVYDDIAHAQRMYNKIGFQSKGTLNSFSITLS
ncbi:acyl-CoA N-acyltransferase [Cunninghamella echinulata]|nr:acyl-CoA N-acyltransferase [Cunninghamella echinulata]